MSNELKNLNLCYKMFNDVIKYVLNNVINYFKISIDNINITRINNRYFIINNLIKYDGRDNVFEYNNIKYKPMFNNKCVLGIFKESMLNEIYNSINWNIINEIIEELEDSYELYYQINDEICIAKMIKDIASLTKITK